jgi:hypothetical protein
VRIESISNCLSLSALVFLCLLPISVSAVSTNYDMSYFLNQGHPFSVQSVPTRQMQTPSVFTKPSNAILPSTKKTPFRVTALTTNTTPIDHPSLSQKLLGGILSEVRIGTLLHDFGPFSSSKESGIDGNLEFLLTAPDLFNVIWSPRPIIGVSYNSNGDTSQAYAGLEWEKKFWGEWFASFSLGGAVHDGHLVGELDGRTGEKSLGCRILFREALGLGYRFLGKHAIMLHFDHISNASLCKKNTANGQRLGRHTVTINEGLENFGIRYGYLF